MGKQVKCVGGGGGGYYIKIGNLKKGVILHEELKLLVWFVLL